MCQGNYLPIDQFTIVLVNFARLDRQRVTSTFFKKISAECLVVVQAYAELEPDTPGTIQGLTYALGGKKIVLADPSGLVTAVRYY